MTIRQHTLSRDFHTHTKLSVCALGEMTVRAIVRRAERLGYRQLGISDHLGEYTAPSDLKKHRRRLSRLETDVNVFLGCEMNVEPSGEPVFASAEIDFLDYVMAAAEHAVGSPVDPTTQPMDWLRCWVGRVERLIEWRGRIDVLAHPLRTLRGHCRGKPLMAHLPAERWEELMRGLARRGTAVELTDAVENYPTSFDATREVYAIARDQGVRFSIGSDAHGLDRLGFQANWVRLARDLKLTGRHLWSPGG